jgi:pyruvate ferredoxin oxidoreductase alpha subunit
MSKKIGIEVSIAAAEAVGMADVDVVAAYPITPQTHIVEHLSEMVADGKLDAEFIPVESEHSAMSVACGASATGARTFTCTSSQGLAVMNEVVFLAASLRLPIVMALANRSLSGPLSIWNDHSDVMSIRDCGWIQIFTENGQDVIDHMIYAFKVAEKQEVSLPFIVNLDGFCLTHVIEPIEFWEEEWVKEFLPEFKPVNRLDPGSPITLGALGMPNIFTEAKRAHEQALLDSKSVLIDTWKEMGDLTGRYYHPVEEYKTEGAEILFLTMGSYGEIASLAIDELQEQGESVGLLKLRLWRPFPQEEILAAIKGAKQIIVIDRAVSFGGVGGPVAAEIRSALYHLNETPVITNYICGLAGRDVTRKDFAKMHEMSKKRENDSVKQSEYVFYGVRE